MGSISQRSTNLIFLSFFAAESKEQSKEQNNDEDKEQSKELEDKGPSYPEREEMSEPELSDEEYNKLLGLDDPD